MKKREGTLQFKENYVKLHEEGLSVAQIAEKYGVTPEYGYKLIHQIADEMGVEYKTLICFPHKPHVIIGSTKGVKRVKPIDSSGFEEERRFMISTFDKTINSMNKVLEEWEINEE